MDAQARPPARLRRLRKNPRVRSSVRETSISPASLFLPVFVDPTLTAPVPIASIPGHYRWPVSGLDDLAKRAGAAGLGGLLFFGRPTAKDAQGSGAWAPDGAVQRALQALRGRYDLTLVTDVCLCAYTDSGHCGYWVRGNLENESSVEALGKVAVSHARAGADWVAPSAMLDGQVRIIRDALDQAGFRDTAILAYAAKYASALYGPFREAEDSAPLEGDRRGYQMDPANVREALREMQADADEGADVLMVKPALPNLDVLARARPLLHHPLAAYQVSGEYAMIKAAAERGWLEEPRAVAEVLTSIRRAGADLLISYYALEAVESHWI